MLGSGAVVAVAAGAMVSEAEVSGPLEIAGVGLAGGLDVPPQPEGTNNAQTAATRRVFIHPYSTPRVSLHVSCLRALNYTCLKNIKSV